MYIQGGSNMTGTAAAQCGLFTHKSVPVIFEPPCTVRAIPKYFSSTSIDKFTDMTDSFLLFLP
jgi:peroxiredoxin